MIFRGEELLSLVYLISWSQELDYSFSRTTKQHDIDCASRTRNLFSAIDKHESYLELRNILFWFGLKNSLAE